MRIFLSCQQSLQKHDVPAYGFWEGYFKNGIEEAGCQWVEAKDVDWAEGLTYLNEKDLKKWRDRAWTQILISIKKQHQKQPIDLFLSYLFPKQVEPAAIQAIQALGIPCVNFFCDNVREFIKIPNEFYCFDLHWVPEFKALQMYQQAKLKHLHVPMPVWVPLKQRICNHPENYGISFIGSRDIQREALLAQVLKLGAKVEIRGAAWNRSMSLPSVIIPPNQNLWQTTINQWRFLRQQGFRPWLRKIQAKSLPSFAEKTFADFVRRQPDATEYISITQQSIVTLGINRYPSFRYPFSKPATYSRMRDIEAPMMGACYLTEWTEGLEHLYNLGQEIETYRTPEEMVEKIQMLKADPKKRVKIRYEGQKRALSDHTVKKSIHKILKIIGLS